MPSPRLTIVSVVVALAALILVVELLRRRRLREKYAVIWVVISISTVIVAFFPGVLSGVANLVGIQTPSNLLFFSSVVILFAVSLQLSREVGLLEEQSRRLAEEVGAAKLRLDALERDRADYDESEPSEQSPGG
ncbi:DUF2304 domain-containing protein [Pseudonocardia hydrocarbonoxydans]|uniref:DUF2304 domain-containing protein n=1 Tax=Pseudonocardia hydrocarbonoxydans TaxID=76726 RepID=A0A4Y3WVE6_9PSEU|nr:DUF2304 domain-containing protein [Pseudonocardia hydrocarbonoxydans]GEC22060.1 hypothetical protein PHY01_43430 [Pseudonocardia hydrocarbonoxydans]